MKKLLLLALPFLFAYCGNTPPKVDEDKPYKGRTYAKQRAVAFKNVCDSTMYYQAKALLAAGKYKQKIDVTASMHIYIMQKEYNPDTLPAKCLRAPLCTFIAAEDNGDLIRMRFEGGVDAKYLKNIGENYIFELHNPRHAGHWHDLVVYNVVKNKFRSTQVLSLAKDYSVENLVFEKDSIYIKFNNKTEVFELKTGEDR